MYRLNPQFSYEKLEDGMVVYDAIHEKTHILNEGAAIVVSNGGKLDSIINEFKEVFSLHQDIDTLKCDIEAFLNRLLTDRILIGEEVHNV